MHELRKYQRLLLAGKSSLTRARESPVLTGANTLDGGATSALPEKGSKNETAWLGA
jgi:hypothetical protein